jgi:uncharacterized protein (TIGR02285 family)
MTGGKMVTSWLLGLALLLTFTVQAKPVLYWLKADLKPYFMQDGALRNQGALDKAQQMLMDRMPLYEHRIQWVSLVRREQELAQTEHAACSFAMLKTAERQHLQYSDPVVAASGYAVVMLKGQPLYQRWQAQGQPDISDWLLQQADAVGLMEAGRAVPDFMRQHNAGTIITFALQTNPVALLAHGRADYLLEYPSRANYLRYLFNDAEVALHYVYLHKQQVNISYVACSPATSARAMADINEAVATLLPEPEYLTALFEWVDTASLEMEYKLYRQHILPATNH